MKLKDQVCSLDLAKKLKELGEKQESLWYWCNFNQRIDEGIAWESYKIEEFDIKCRYYIDWEDVEDNEDYETISAPTCAELEERLPTWIKNPTRKMIVMWKCKTKYAIQYKDDYGNKENFPNEPIWDNTGANTRAKMLICLIEKKLIDLEEEK